MTFVPIMIPLALMAMALGPMLSWKRGDLWAALQRLKLGFAIAAGKPSVSTMLGQLMGYSSVGAACGLAHPPRPWLLTAVIIVNGPSASACSRAARQQGVRRALRLPRAAWA